MKKLLILPLLLMVSTSVLAEWTNVDGNLGDGVTVYADFGAIKRKGHKVKMWNLLDYKTVQEALKQDQYALFAPLNLRR